MLKVANPYTPLPPDLEPDDYKIKSTYLTLTGYD